MPLVPTPHAFVLESGPVQTHLFRKYALFAELDDRELASIAAVAKSRRYAKDDVVFHADESGDVFCLIKEGQVKITMISPEGKEIILSMLGPGDFFGEGCLAGQPVRMGSATAITPSVILRINKEAMVKLLHKQHAMSDRFLTHMLARNIRIEEDLIDQLFNSSEKRLARTLLLLARYGKHDAPVRAVPPISQETLAEMIGTTRSRVNFFMKKFQRLGFIDYKHGLKVNNALLTVVLHD